MNLQELVKSVANKFKTSNLKDWGGVIANKTSRNDYANTVVKPMVSKVASIPSKVVEMAKMTVNPYGKFQLRETVRQKISPTIPFELNNFYQVGNTTPQWETLSPQKQAEIRGLDTADELVYPRVKDSSSIIKYQFQNPSGDAKGNALRDNQLKSGGYTPQVQKYIKSTGTLIQPEGSNIGNGWSAGRSYGNGGGPRFVEVSPGAIHQPYLAGHELMHQIDMVSKTYKPDEFLKSVQVAATKNPNLGGALNFIKGYQEQQPEYFKNNPNTLAVETFAEIGSRLGPSVLQDPNLAKYYKGIFQETPQNYPGWVNPAPAPTNPKNPQPQAPSMVVPTLKPVNGVAPIEAILSKGISKGISNGITKKSKIKILRKIKK